MMTTKEYPEKMYIWHDDFMCTFDCSEESEPWTNEREYTRSDLVEKLVNEAYKDGFSDAQFGTHKQYKED